MNTYDFHQVAIPRNGIVDAVESVDDLYTASLQLKVVAGKVALGRFGHSARGPCRASETFTAKRTGR